jgi:hypothetical protein
MYSILIKTSIVMCISQLMKKLKNAITTVIYSRKSRFEILFIFLIEMTKSKLFHDSHLYKQIENIFYHGTRGAEQKMKLIS